MTPDRIAALRELVIGLRNAAEMSHASHEDDAANALTEALDAIARVRTLADDIAAPGGEEQVVPHFIRVLISEMIRAALDGTAGKGDEK